MSAAGGTQVMTATVVNDQGVVQVHDKTELAEEQDAVATRCAAQDKFPSLASVGDALAAGSEVDEAGMLATVGGGACEGAQWTRYMVRVGAVPFVVCWTGSFEDVQVVGEDFYAVLDVSRSVDAAAMAAVVLPAGTGGVTLDCPLLDQALFNSATATSRRLNEQPAAPLPLPRRRRLCEDCEGNGNGNPEDFPPIEDCCTRRLDGTPDFQPLPEHRQRHRQLARQTTIDTGSCSRSRASNTKHCVFVHGLGVTSSNSDAKNHYST